MLKAAAGGGGRGIRLVSEPAAMTEAFERCRSEAAAAFGDGGLFVERVLRRPRHIEVQILADADGNTVHLYERDCSVQLRNQKVVEVAPAAGLDESLRQRILDDAVRLARAATYVNAGTLEFLVVPETADYFFIEGNPRIQVEHTVTEQITGIDLVEAQLRIATGASLTALGLGDQAAVGRPRGYAVQARVVATGTGTISGYREPSGRASGSTRAATSGTPRRPSSTLSWPRSSARPPPALRSAPPWTGLDGRSTSSIWPACLPTSGSCGRFCQHRR